MVLLGYNNIFLTFYDCLCNVSLSKCHTCYKKYFRPTYMMPNSFGDLWITIPNMLLSWDVKMWNAAAVTNALRTISDINQLNFPNFMTESITCHNPVAKQREVAYDILSRICCSSSLLLLLLPIKLLEFSPKRGNWKVLSDVLLYVISFLFTKMSNNG